jgi:hypothetical protein
MVDVYTHYQAPPKKAIDAIVNKGHLHKMRMAREWKPGSSIEERSA